MKDYFFDDVDNLVTRLKRLDPDMGPIRLQKSLYFLFAFYGATFGSIEGTTEEGELSEIENLYPKKLFKGAFEAWQYGPVIRDVYFKNKNGAYDKNEDTTELFYTERDDREVLKFIDNLLEDLNEMSDFALVDRTHQDKSWKNKFDPKKPYSNNIIDNEELVAEYIEKMRLASAL